MEFKTPSMEAIWPIIRKLLAQSYSLIPVRERADDHWPAKSPFTGWKSSQSKRLTENELWKQMDKNYTTSVALICGAISGNVEAIDVDTKNKPGIDATLFSDIKEFFPNLWNILRIHRTPSGGYHILYRIEGTKPVPGNRKLAARPQTEAEMEESRTKNPRAFIETRGEGGYVLVPPSGGYAVAHDTDDLPTITWEERCALIALCESYSEIKREEEKSKNDYKPKDNDYYSVNPFEDFNLSNEAETFISQFGWQEYDRSTKFVWYTRPGTVRGGIHAAFLRDSRLYYFFTTNSEFEPERCYQPATVLSTLKFGGDKKETYKHLVALGFGRIKPEREAIIVTRNADAGLPLPPNASTEASAAYQARVDSNRERYPFGTFWECEEPENGFTINRIRLYEVAGRLGFKHYETLGDVVRIEGYTIRFTTQRAVYDALRAYIKEDYDVRNCFESFLQKSGKFSLDSFELLDESLLMRDTRDTCYKFFEDVWIEIRAYSFSEYNYDELGGRLIWANQIQQRKFRLGEGGRYVDFLEKALEYGKTKNHNKHIESVIGSLSHAYKDDTMGYILVLTEQVEDPLYGGGAGKNIFCNLLEKTTSVKTIPGSQLKFDEKFMQTWDGERVFVISDVEKDFNYLNLKEPSSGRGKIKKLYKNEVIIPVGLMPKFVVITNYSYEVKDGGLKRRIVPLEFTDFFTKSGGVDVHYGGIHFPNDWTTEDWAGFDGTIITSVQTWMREGLKLSNDLGLTLSGWRKQFDQAYWNMLPFIEENMPNWLQVGYVSNDDLKKLLDSYYMENNVQKKYEWSGRRLNQGLSIYCKHHGIDFAPDVQKKVKLDMGNGLSMQVNAKVRLFIKNDEIPPF